MSLRKLVLIVLLLLLAGQFLGSQQLQFRTNPKQWRLRLSSTELTGGAGTDFATSYESAADAISLTINHSTGSWDVEVRRGDTNWHSDLSVYVRRTSSNGGISGGQSYQQVTTNNESFFSGTGDVSGINVQIMIQGTSVSLPVDSYETTIYYTITDES